MNRSARFAGTILVCAIAVIALERVAIRPYSINRSKKTVQKATEEAYRIDNASIFAPAARRNVERLQAWVEFTPQDIDLYMILAANLRLLGRPKEAIDAYESALVWDRRPEIYFNLGMTQVDSGARERGLENIVRAVRFSRDYLQLIDEPSLRTEAEQLAQQRPVS